MNFRPNCSPASQYNKNTISKLSTILKKKDRDKLENYEDTKPMYLYHHKEDLYYPKELDTENYDLGDFCKSFLYSMQYYSVVQNCWNNESFEFSIMNSNTDYIESEEEEN